jgi:hypothetical protein
MKCGQREAMTREEELVARGWQIRSTQDEPRLSEMVTLYEDLGLEVRLEPFDPGVADGCRDCIAVNPNLYRTIYTRKRTEAG